MDGNSPLCKCLIQGAHQPADSPPCDWIPAVHAGMTGFNHLCITMRAGAWERAKIRIARQIPSNDKNPPFTPSIPVQLTELSPYPTEVSSEHSGP